jgi:glucokinase
MYLGIEIGGTKLQLGLGAGNGVLNGLWRRTVDVAAGPEGIRRQITAAVPELLTKADIDRSALKGIGIGFGGPVDDTARTIIKSHQIEGWDNFPLADWISELVGLPSVLGNDADVAGLAEALHGAGKGLSPIFYITIGSGIGGGLIIDGEIYRGVGRGAAEIGHLKIPVWNGSDLLTETLEDVASGWGMTRRAKYLIGTERAEDSSVLPLAGGDPGNVSATVLGQAAADGDPFAKKVIQESCEALADSICHVIALLCPRRIVIGGGVALIGEKLLFDPVRKLVNGRVFKPFAGLTDIVPAALGEEVVVHGALALARKRLRG